MKIKETVHRECCLGNNDLKIYKGRSKNIQEKEKPMFCKHCGQVWILTRQMDAAGDMEPCRVPVILTANKVSNHVTL